PTNNRPSVVKIAVVTTFIAALAVSPLAVAQEQHGADTAASKEVTGEVVDMMCYVDHNAVGEKHGQACGAKCVKSGGPVGIRSDGRSLPIRRAFSTCKSGTFSSDTFRISPDSSTAIGNPSRNKIRFAVNAASRGLGVRIPCRFRGSAALSVISSPLDDALRMERNNPIASGKANCSPLTPPTK